ncbi:MAG: hypothetical protein JWO31_3213, partial [Phycisphaerales bacterium]|nr:hypothetical protein [Phycisphaerales bacterium]
MQSSSRSVFGLLLPAAVLGLATGRAAAVTTYYFDVDGTTAGFGTVNGLTFNWDDT